ncbi:Transthyretin-like protein 46, partial [Trichinella nativa]
LKYWKMMNLKQFHKLLLFAFIVIVSLTLAKKQRVRIQGKLMCGDQPASKIAVKLIEKDLTFDDTMAKNETNTNGEFYLDGTDDEMGTIEPYFKIYHRCNSHHVCKRRWKIKVPSKYITDANGPAKVFNIGTVNLELKIEEDKKCMPV